MLSSGNHYGQAVSSVFNQNDGSEMKDARSAVECFKMHMKNILCFCGTLVHGITPSASGTWVNESRS